ncbi:MAG TPA: hypothetical protein VG328_18770 [Stellaceae bacterium]|jgi:flagellar hook-associated protein FlgK|nr:hypothetical protein [Stellaceae bacterium]
MSQSNAILNTKRFRSKTDEAQYWRGRAAEVRKVEQLFSDPDARSRLEEIAHHYDEMAQALAENLSVFP